jgi:ABC-type nickel/cobalt efflux system permease component RcnA
MSGATSIPLAFVALFSDGTYQKESFAILAFLALWVCVIRTAWKSEQLQARLDERAKHREDERRLVDYHAKIGNRVHEIRNMYDSAYAKKYKQDYLEGRMDADSLALLDDIAKFLGSEIGPASTLDFWNRDNVKLTPVAVKDEDSFKTRHWQHCMDWLNHYATQLETITRKYAETKAKINE